MLHRQQHRQRLAQLSRIARHPHHLFRGSHLRREDSWRPCHEQSS
jgi:hypothetical protein